MQFPITNHFVRGIRKETLQTAEKRIIVPGTNLLHELLNFKRGFYFIGVRIIRKQKLHEPLLHFAIRESQTVNPEFTVIPLDGEVTALINYGNRIGRGRVDAVQYIRIGFHMRHFMKIIVMYLQEFYQIGRSTRFKPIISKFHFIERIQQAERIVNADRIFHKMVPVIACLQFTAHLFITHPLPVGKFVQLLIQIGPYFLLGDAAQCHVTFVHRQIDQIVQSTEHTHFTKLGDTGQKSEPDVSIHCFDSSIKGLQGLAKLFLQFFIPNGLQHGLIIFIHQNDYTMPRQFTGTLYDTGKAQRQRALRRFSSIEFLP